MSEDHLQSELVKEFRGEYQGQKVEVELLSREHYSPKPIAIKDESGEKIASYELDIVRCSPTLLYVWRGDASQPLEPRYHQQQHQSFKGSHQIYRYAERRIPLAEEETAARGDREDYQARSRGDQVFPREFPSRILQNAALSIPHQEEPIYASFFRLTENEKKKHIGWRVTYKDEGRDFLATLGSYKLNKETDENFCKLLLR